MKNTVFLLILIAFLMSCSSNSFVKRRYTKGTFKEHKESPGIAVKTGNVHHRKVPGIPVYYIPSDKALIRTEITKFASEDPSGKFPKKEIDPKTNSKASTDPPLIQEGRAHGRLPETEKAEKRDKLLTRIYTITGYTAIIITAKILEVGTVTMMIGVLGTLVLLIGFGIWLWIHLRNAEYDAGKQIWKVGLCVVVMAAIGLIGLPTLLIML